MCRDGQCMPTTAQKVLGRMLHDIAEALAAETGVSGDDVRIGPVDFGPVPVASEAHAASDAPGES